MLRRSAFGKIRSLIVGGIVGALGAALIPHLFKMRHTQQERPARDGDPENRGTPADEESDQSPDHRVGRGVLIGAAAAILGGVVGGWIQGWSSDYFESKRSVAAERKTNEQRALEWAANGRRGSFRRADLEGADLRIADLGCEPNSNGLDLREIDWESLDERKGADLSYSNLKRANLCDAYLQYCDLRGANLEGARAERANLRGANLTEANLRDGVFKHADLRGARLEGARLSRIDLEGAQLSGASLFDADVEGANLSGANLVGTDLRQANLTSVDLEGASYDDSTQWPRRFTPVTLISTPSHTSTTTPVPPPPTDTPSNTPTCTLTPSHMPTTTPTDTPMPTYIATLARTLMVTPCHTSTCTPPRTPSPTVTLTDTPTMTPTATPTPKPKTAAVKPAGFFGYGIQADLITDTNHERIYNHIKAIGFNWAKQQVEWFRYNAGPGQYDWGALDRIVEGANAHGINLLFSVVKAPRWSRPPQDTDQGPPADPDTYGAFLRDMAVRYKGRVKAYEIWNEQNVYYEWGGRGHKLNAARYVELLKVAYNAIKSVDPGAIVISGALASTGYNDGDIAINDGIYLEQMYQAGLGRYCDAIGAHPSGYNNPADADWRSWSDPPAPSFKGHPSFFFRGTMELYRNIMIKYGDGRKRIWPTEFGWASIEGLRESAAWGYEYSADNSEAEQAQFIVRAYQIGKAWGWVGPMFLWNLNFAPVAGRSDEKAAFSIVYEDWSARPAFVALRDMPKQ